MTVTQKEFDAKINTLCLAFEQKQIIGSNLQVVNGYKWVIIKLLKNLARPLYWMLNWGDPFAAYRIEYVGRAIFKYCTENVTWYRYSAQYRDLYDKLAKKVTSTGRMPGKGYIRGLGRLHDAAKRNDDLYPSPRISITISRTLAEHQKTVVEAVNRLGTCIHARLCEASQKSVVFSPMSLMIVLGMLLEAIPKQNQEKYLAALGIREMSVNDFHEALGANIKALPMQQAGGGGFVKIAQAIAVKSQNRGIISERLQNLVQNTYQASVVSASQGLKSTVNDWASRNTDNRIKELMNEEPDEDAVVLLNAISMDVKWESQFKADDTRDDKFDAENGMTRCRMMTQTHTFSHFDGDSFQMIELPYRTAEGRQLSQIIVLPKGKEDLTKVENEVMNKNFMDLVQRCRSAAKATVRLSLPKVQVETTQTLLQILKDIGFPLDDIDDEVIKLTDAYISEVLQKVFFANDEEGTIAAVATEAIAAKAGRESSDVTFRVDRSYAYAIMDRNTVIFYGNVRDKEAVKVNS